MPTERHSPPRVAPAALAEMIDPARSALLVVDVQEDFASPTGAMARMGADLSGVNAVVGRIAELIEAARGAGATVAFTQVMTSAATDSKALKLLNARRGRSPDALEICRQGERGSAYHRVSPRPGEIQATKRLFNAFHGTRLDEDLRERGVGTLVVAGLTTNCCVDATCRDAFHRDFNVLVVSDATDAYGGETQTNALVALSENCALITDTAAVLATWNPRPRGS
ncbi:MAG: cysteine hydrolase family protein [Caulobacterales bacterium]